MVKIRSNMTPSVSSSEIELKSMKKSSTMTPSVSAIELRSSVSAYVLEEEKSVPQSFFRMYMVVLPNSNFSYSWNFFILCLLSYICTIVPVLICFSIDGSATHAMDFILDIAFIIDVYINFVSAFYENDSMLKTDFKSIATTYLKSWFVLDFFTSIPFSWFGAGWLVNAKYAKMLRIFKLLKMARVSKAGRILDQFQEKFEIKNTVVLLAKFFFVTIFVAHWLGCFFYGIAASNNFENSWVANYEPYVPYEPPLQERSFGNKYVVSIYWAVTTMSTIGFGDIVPKNNDEYVFAMFAMISGALVYAYGLTNMCTLVFNFNKRKVAFNGKVDDLIDMLTSKNIPSELKQRVTRYVYYSYFTSNETKERENQILSLLSPALRTEVATEMLHYQFRSVVILHQYGSQFLRAICTTLNSCVYPPGELIVRRNTILDHILLVSNGEVNYYQDVSLVASGNVESIWSSVITSDKRKSLCAIQEIAKERAFKLGKISESKHRTDELDACQYVNIGAVNATEYTLQPGCSIGEYAALTFHRPDFSLFAKSHCEIYSLNAKEYSKMIVKNFGVESLELLNISQEKRFKYTEVDFCIPLGVSPDDPRIPLDISIKTNVDAIHAQLNEQADMSDMHMSEILLAKLHDAKTQPSEWVHVKHVVITDSFTVRELRQGMLAQIDLLITSNCKHLSCRHELCCLFHNHKRIAANHKRNNNNTESKLLLLKEDDDDDDDESIFEEYENEESESKQYEEKKKNVVSIDDNITQITILLNNIYEEMKQQCEYKPRDQKKLMSLLRTELLLEDAKKLKMEYASSC